jgi:hypothetical protein
MVVEEQADIKIPATIKKRVNIKDVSLFMLEEN